MIFRELQNALSDLDQEFFINPVWGIKNDTELGGFAFQVFAGEIISRKRTDNPESAEARFRLKCDVTESKCPFGYFFFSAGASSCA